MGIQFRSIEPSMLPLKMVTDQDAEFFLNLMF